MNAFLTIYAMTKAQFDSANSPFISCILCLFLKTLLLLKAYKSNRRFFGDNTVFKAAETSKDTKLVNKQQGKMHEQLTNSRHTIDA